MPHRKGGHFSDIHREALEAWANPDRGVSIRPNILTLIPREHLKSVCAAIYATWRIARDPTYTILYRVADEELGKLQIGMMKNIFESDEFMKVWPDHFFPDEGRRDKWSAWAVNTDHPDRKRLNIRDESIVVKTNKSGKVGRHPQEIIFDDVVTPENVYTVNGRREVAMICAADVSLVSGVGLMTAVGTRYHDEDQYYLWETEMVDVYNDDKELTGQEHMWQVIEHVVEDKGDGTGNFLWPKEWSPITKQYHGWDTAKLATKRAGYKSAGQMAHFYAQYYMDPNDPDSHNLDRSVFQYLDRRHLEHEGGTWYYAGKELRIFAGMDTAQTDVASRGSNTADFTAIAIIGVDHEGFVYVLGTDQFQTDKKHIWWQHVKDLYQEWGFWKLIVESNGGGKFVADGLKESIRRDGLGLVVEAKPTPNDRSKVERAEAILFPRYQNGTVYHMRGGYIRELEDQVILPRPTHDDLREALVIAVDDSVVPSKRYATVSNLDAYRTQSHRFLNRSRRG